MENLLILLQVKMENKRKTTITHSHWTRLHKSALIQSVKLLLF